MTTKRSFKRFETKLRKASLFGSIRSRATKMHVSLRELYEGNVRPTPSIAAARRDVYVWLHDTKGKSVNEIARLFDRAPSGVLRMVKS